MRRSGRVALIAAGLMPFAAAGAADVPKIVVQGFGSVEAPPDLVTIYYSVRGEGLTSDDAVRALVAKSALISGRLQRIDRLVAPETSDLTVTGVRGNDCTQGSDEDNEKVRLSTGTCAIMGYVAVQDFTFKSKQVKDAGTLVGIAGQAGATKPSISGFTISDERPLRQKAVAAAFANARTKAQSVADAGGVQLGPIISANLDRAYGDKDDAIVVTVSAEQFNHGLEAPAPVTVYMTIGPIKTSATLDVTFGVKP